VRNDPGWRAACVGLAWIAGCLGVGDVKGQSLGTPAVGVGSTLGAAGMGPSTVMPFPLAMPMIAPQYLNAAASSGMDIAGNPIQGNVFANPYMLPFFYGSMMPGGLGTGSSGLGTTSSTASSSTAAYRMGMGATQMGLMMMATQNPNGVGSGQLSGVRGRGTPTPSRTPAPTQAQIRRSLSNQPGGLAARYFPRGTPRSGVPRNYYNRQTRYFP
jgi:hypothetical protein